MLEAYANGGQCLLALRVGRIKIDNCDQSVASLPKPLTVVCCVINVYVQHDC